MDQIFRNLDFCYVYINDLLRASKSLEKHLFHLRDVLERRSSLWQLTLLNNRLVNQNQLFLTTELGQMGTFFCLRNFLPMSSSKSPFQSPNLDDFLGL